MIVNIKSKAPFDVYIGRENKYYNLPQSKWANPFVIGKDGTRTEVVFKHRLWIDSQPDLLEAIHIKRELDNKILGCWCDVGKEQCHGAILERKRDSRWTLNWFSNMMSMEPLLYQGVTYLTSENFYQAMKLPKDRVDLRQEIALMNPKKAKIAIRDKKKYTWDASWTK